MRRRTSSGDLEKHDLLIPPYVPSTTWQPTTSLSLTFPSGAQVLLGNEISPSDSSETPTISFTPTSPNETYTILSVDPDATSRANPIYGPVRHWAQSGLVVGADGKVETKESAHMSYKGPGPPPKTGLHRYIFLLYRHTKEIQGVEMDNELMGRIKWDFGNFVDEHGLELVGINFFLSQNPEQ
ncbi:PEBP-like protein [Pseudohyphozyma bogoriensis]|nr:PEBP-like protein [Pseudohyphozyma bogoriensis]